MTKNNQFQEICIRLVKAYVSLYPKFSFQFYFDGEKQDLIGNGENIIEVIITESEKVFKRIFTEGSMGLGEAYCDGLIEVRDDQYEDFLFIFVRAAYDKKIIFKLPLSDIFRIIRARYNREFFTKGTQHADINSHYSLSDWFDDDEDANEFYLQWLDSKYIQYTCAKWDTETMSLEEAQVNKFEFYAKRLGINENSRGKTLLDLGCGWGGFMFYIAEHYGLICKGLTLSTAQAAYIAKEAKDRGLENLVSVEIKNVHDMEGSYDFVSSIGLLEHISDYDDLYKKTALALKADGTALFHAIFHTEMFYKTDPFLLKYIFPGGATPHIEKNVNIFKKYFKSVDRNDLPDMSYPKTLQCWYDTFCQNEGKIRTLLTEKGKCKDVDRAIRIFKHYLILAYCGMAESGVVANIQVKN
jgi:cyclopropane-fatty-acyl-phospholipid synthase